MICMIMVFSQHKVLLIEENLTSVTTLLLLPDAFGIVATKWERHFEFFKLLPHA